MTPDQRSSTRYLIINADGYGMTRGVTRAIEECIEFGTVRSISANVNFKGAERLYDLVKNHPEISVGCHINPVIGPPVLPADKVRSLLDSSGNFIYKNFVRQFLLGKLRMNELRAEMMAQVDKTRQLTGSAFSHVDFHMGLHRLPMLYELFLEVAEQSGTGRIRTHRYRVGMESKHARLTHLRQLFDPPSAAPKYLWNALLRRKALVRGLAMPDYRVGIRGLGFRANTITVENYLRLLGNVPSGFSEFTVHPGHVDDDLLRWSTYISPREAELAVLTSPVFRAALNDSDTQLAGYRDIRTKVQMVTNVAA